MKQAFFSLSLLILFCGLTLFTSCNAPRGVIFQNQTGQPATLTWGLVEERGPANPYPDMDVDTLRLRLAPEGDRSEGGLVFGRGRWNNTEIKRLASRIDFMEVQDGSDSITIRMEEREELEALLKRGVRWPGKRQIRIVIY